MRTPGRLSLLALGGLCLLAGLDAALLLLGLPAPVTAERLPDVHGPLLVLGFVGCVIALERAVALRRAWALAAPAALGAGGLTTLTPLPLAVGAGVLVAGTAALLATYAALWRRQGSGALGLQVLGAVLAVGGALLWWAGVPVPALLPWLVGFLVLTIAGERLELARVGFPGPAAERAVVVAGVAVAAGVVMTLLRPGAAALLGLGILALTGLLVRHDVARRTVRSTGLPRFVAVALLAGYAWLVVAGATWALLGDVREGPAYDAVVHAVFLGFTLSMIMAHAPVILPAVLGVRLPYRTAMHVPVALLHASLVLRVVGGDLRGEAWALATGGALNVAAVLAFVGVAAWSGLTAPRAARPAAAGPARAPEPAGVAG
ncbi:hypothetical protein [Actinotalea solisilvae]|uniref:hypothetical protein n=1 Tax=Actinotalea solisilvae TaxID=2072922 RepID=UPI0027DB2489|nr:hypothetical protein [Actinotalea solisilvae]